MSSYEAFWHEWSREKWEEYHKPMTEAEIAKAMRGYPVIERDKDYYPPIPEEWQWAFDAMSVLSDKINMEIFAILRERNDDEHEERLP